MPRGAEEPLTAAAHSNRSRVALLHGLFWTVSGIWPILHMPSFVAVTGPKHDLWLVRTVAGLITVIGVVLLRAGWRRRVTGDLKLLGIAAAAVLATVDVVYVSAGVISAIYLLDALAEAGLISLWLLGDYMDRRSPSPLKPR